MAIPATLYPLSKQPPIAFSRIHNHNCLKPITAVQYQQFTFIFGSNTLGESAVSSRIRDAALQIFATKGSKEINISELAKQAGVSRGSIYNHVDQNTCLFEQIVADTSRDMYERTVASIDGIDDPAQRLASGVRMFIRRSHDEPHWGRFMVKFALNNEPLRDILTGIIERGIETKRFSLAPSKTQSAVAMLAGTTLSSMLFVQEGHLTWRQAGTDASELILRALGLAETDAINIAHLELPDLAHPIKK